MIPLPTNGEVARVAPSGRYVSLTIRGGSALPPLTAMIPPQPQLDQLRRGRTPRPRGRRPARAPRRGRRSAWPTCAPAACWRGRGRAPRCGRTHATRRRLPAAACHVGRHDRDRLERHRGRRRLQRLPAVAGEDDALDCCAGGIGGVGAGGQHERHRRADVAVALANAAAASRSPLASSGASVARRRRRRGRRRPVGTTSVWPGLPVKPAASRRRGGRADRGRRRRHLAAIG